MSLVDEMDDHLFVLASHSIAELCREAERGTGRKLTIDELCELLTWAVRSCGDGLADVNVENLEALEPKLRRRGKVTVRPGDVVAIPRAGDEKDVYLAVYITSNKRFGHAFGVLRGHHPLKPFRNDPGRKPSALPLPIYTTLHGVASGRWPVVGHAPDLLALFPSQPEIYHHKKYNQENHRIGPFGAAESPTGELRNLTEQEARDVGLLSDEYTQTMVPEELEAKLRRTLG